MSYQLVKVKKGKPMSAYRNKYYVNSHKNGWAVSCENPSPVNYAFHDKNKAKETGRILAKKDHAELIIRDEDGEVEEVLSY